MSVDLVVEDDDREDRRTDIAALAGGVLAVSLSMLAEPGTYDIIGAIISISLALVIASYVIGRRRNLFQSLSVGMVIGLVVLPIIGFVYDRIYSRDPIVNWRHYIEDVRSDCEIDQTPRCENDSRMTELPHLGIWLISSLLATVVDRVAMAAMAPRLRLARNDRSDRRN